MKELLKKYLRGLLIKLELPVTKNIEYDIYTEKILKGVLSKSSNCIDVGAHNGEILDLFLAFAPDGKHFAFEPIPQLFETLKKNYSGSVSVFPFALSSFDGVTEFNLVLDDPAYSGLKQRQYKTTHTKIEKLKVEVRKLDDVLSAFSEKIDVIKIDVEGGEFDVLKGATKTLSDHKPLLIFECGKGASDFYGTKPEEIFEFLAGFGYEVFTLKSFYRKKDKLDTSGFVKAFEDGGEYYFVGVVI